MSNDYKFVAQAAGDCSELHRLLTGGSATRLLVMGNNDKATTILDAAVTKCEQIDIPANWSVIHIPDPENDAIKKRLRRDITNWPDPQQYLYAIIRTAITSGAAAIVEQGTPNPVDADAATKIADKFGGTQ